MLSATRKQCVRSSVSFLLAFLLVVMNFNGLTYVSAAEIQTIDQIKDNTDDTSVEGQATVTYVESEDTIYVQDATSGIKIYGMDNGNDFSIGDEVEFTGTLSTYQNEREIVIESSEDIEIIGTGDVPDPEVVTVGEIGESTEGTLVQLEGLTLDEADSTTCVFSDTTGTALNVYVANAQDFSEEDLVEGDTYTLVGIAAQYGDDYEVKLRMASDLTNESDDEEITYRTDYNFLELEDYDDWDDEDVNPYNQSPMKVESGNSNDQIANTYDGAWLEYDNMDFDDIGVNTVDIEYCGKSGNCAADAAVEIYLDGLDGTLVGTVDVPPTDTSWGTYKTATATLDTSITGVHDLYFVLTGTTDSTYKYIGNFDNASFYYSDGEEDEEEDDSDFSVYDLNYSLGSTINELNFAWLSTGVANVADVEIALASDQTEEDVFPDDYVLFQGTVTEMDDDIYSNKVEATGLDEDESYIYRVGNGNHWSDIHEINTGDSDSYSFLAVGDPQIGASSISSDEEGWQDTVEKALGEFSDTDFFVSLGDQVNNANNEDQYEAFFSPEELQDLPLVTFQGNHDNSSNYLNHYNNPNMSDTYGTTDSGGDYYYTYGNTLFLVLNSNNTSTASHEAFMEEAIEENPDVEWKVVMFHHAIYSSANHSQETDIVTRRTELTPVFDDLGIDVVLMGHDHCYTRTYQMLGNEAQEDQTTNEDGAVVDPTGTLYMTLNSGSGSKYYDMKATAETYAAVREQLEVPTFSRVSIDDDSFTIDTYRTDTMELTDTYTIVKTNDSETTETVAGLEADTTTLIQDTDETQELSVYLTMKDIENLDTIDATISYDSDAYTLESVETVDAENTICDFDDEDGAVRIIAGFTEPLDIEDATPVLQLTFLVNDMDLEESLSTAFEISDISYTDAESHEEAVATISSDTGQIDVVITTYDLLADLNGDGAITIEDLSIALSYYRVESTDDDWSDAEIADLNEDGIIDITDYGLLVSYILNLD